MFIASTSLVWNIGKVCISPHSHSHLLLLLSLCYCYFFQALVIWSLMYFSLNYKLCDEESKDWRALKVHSFINTSWEMDTLFCLKLCLNKHNNPYQYLVPCNFSAFRQVLKLLTYFDIKQMYSYIFVSRCLKTQKHEWNNLQIVLHAHRHTHIYGFGRS